jgi:hypothetical protein
LGLWIFIHNLRAPFAAKQANNFCPAPSPTAQIAKHADAAQRANKQQTNIVARFDLISSVLRVVIKLQCK